MTLLIIEGPMTPKQIEDALPHVNKDQTRYALRRLIESKIIRRIPNLLDMRSVYFRIATEQEIEEIKPNLSRRIQKLISDAVSDANMVLEMM